MKKPTINDYPITDERTFLNLNGSVNWQRYAKALDAYIEITTPQVAPQASPQVAAQPSATAEVEAHTSCPICGRSFSAAADCKQPCQHCNDFMSAPKPFVEDRTVRDFRTDEEILRKYVFTEGWDHTDVVSKENALKAMKECASLKPVAEREVSDEEIEEWATKHSESNGAALNKIWGAKWMRELIKERN